MIGVTNKASGYVLNSNFGTDSVIVCSVFVLSEVLTTLVDGGHITRDIFDSVNAFVAQNRFQQESLQPVAQPKAQNVSVRRFSQ